jgi:hypothetical protein
MYSRLMKVINATDSLPISPDDQRQLLDYAKSLPKRFQVMRLVESREQDIAEAAIEQMQELYPNFEYYHENGWEKGVRDLGLVLRCNVQAMLMDDVEVNKDKLLSWFRTLNENLSLSPQFVRDCYTALLEACRGMLPADAFALLEPHLRLNVEYLSDFPEPAVVAN